MIPSNFLKLKFLFLTALLLLTLGVSGSQAQAQTAGGTIISNQASATYSDGGGGSYATVSNTVTVTVANVSGLTITPDLIPVLANVAPGQTGILYHFVATNTGNFTDQVQFETGGASIRIAGPGTVTAAVIDVDNSNTINAGDTNIFTNGSPVTSVNINAGSAINILVSVDISGAATATQTVVVTLGDAAGPSPYDDRAYSDTANDVRTVGATSVNGLREARGDISATVENDASLLLTMSNNGAANVPLGNDITYTLTVQNLGNRDATGVTLGGQTRVYMIAPIPLRTVLKSGQTFPAGTLYTTDALSTLPLAATWSTTAPVDLTTLTRIALPAAATLVAGATSGGQNMIVTVNTGINAANPIEHIADVFALNSTAVTIDDQSGDAVTNDGDNNADFNEGTTGDNDGDGRVELTTLQAVGSVLVGPNGAPNATGTTQNNDYTNLSVDVGIATVAPGGVTTVGDAVVYTNTIQNTGNASDTFTITAPTVNALLTSVEVSTNGGGSYTTISGGGSVTLAVGLGASANILVRVTAPAGLTVLTGYETVIRVTSGNTPASNNETIDRLWTGFVRLDKTATVANATGVGGATDPVPGADISFAVTYTNVTTSTGSGNANLSATTMVITENGNAPNNWGASTTHVSASDLNPNATVAHPSAPLYTDTITTLAPAGSGTFTVVRKIN